MGHFVRGRSARVQTAAYWDSVTDIDSSYGCPDMYFADIDSETGIEQGFGDTAAGFENTAAGFWDTAAGFGDTAAGFGADIEEGTADTAGLSRRLLSIL